MYGVITTYRIGGVISTTEPCITQEEEGNVMYQVMNNNGYFVTVQNAPVPTRVVWTNIDGDFHAVPAYFEIA